MRAGSKYAHVSLKPVAGVGIPRDRREDARTAFRSILVSALIVLLLLLFLKMPLHVLLDEAFRAPGELVTLVSTAVTAARTDPAATPSAATAGLPAGTAAVAATPAGAVFAVQPPGARAPTTPQPTQAAAPGAVPRPPDASQQPVSTSPSSPSAPAVPTSPSTAAPSSGGGAADSPAPTPGAPVSPITTPTSALVVSYALAILLGLVLLNLFLKWQPTFGRLELPLLILSAPLVGRWIRTQASMRIRRMRTQEVVH